MKDTFADHSTLGFKKGKKTVECGSNLVERHYFQLSDKLVSLSFGCSKDLISKQDWSEVIQCIMYFKSNFLQ